MVGTAVSLTATASLALIGWVPFVGLLVWPLQAAAWILRGLAVPVHQPDVARGLSDAIPPVRRRRSTRPRPAGSRIVQA